MQITKNKYNTGDLIIIKDESYKSPYGNFPLLASVEFCGKGFDIEAKYKEQTRMTDAELDDFTKGMIVPQHLADFKVLQYPIELLSEYVIVVLMDREYAQKTYSRDKVLFLVNQVVPFYHQRGIKIQECTTKTVYEIHKIDANLGASKRQIKKGIYFHLRGEHELVRSKLVSYDELKRGFDIYEEPAENMQ